MKYLFILLLICISEVIFAQGSNGRIRVSGVVSYKEDTPKGHFYAVQKKQLDEPVSENVTFTPGGTGWTYSWTYNDTPGQPVVYNADSSQIVVDLVGDGYYLFRAEKEGEQAIEEKFYVFFDYLEINISYEDRFDCQYIKIKIAYPHLPEDNGFPGWANVDYWVIWKGEERQLTSMADYVYSEISQSVVGCSENVRFKIRVKDKFGLYWESNEDIYESVIPKAEAELELGNTVDIVGEVNEEMGQAPLEVGFHSSGSVNADSYEWLLYKDTAAIVEFAPTLLDSLLGEQIRTMPEFLYTYEHTGRYKVVLIATNGSGNHCTDTTAPLYVNVVESLVDVPNVFTPNGDGKNDVFMVKALSVENFHAVILNRWGRQVYEWSDPMGGWDGRIHGKLANPGTYFYIVTARGREKNNPPSYVKKGALMLIR